MEKEQTWYAQQPGWISDVVCCVKEASLKRRHTALFHFYDRSKITLWALTKHVGIHLNNLKNKFVVLNLSGFIFSEELTQKCDVQKLNGLKRF